MCNMIRKDECNIPLMGSYSETELIKVWNVVFNSLIRFFRSMLWQSLLFYIGKSVLKEQMLIDEKS